MTESEANYVSTLLVQIASHEATINSFSKKISELARDLSTAQTMAVHATNGAKAYAAEADVLRKKIARMRRRRLKKLTLKARSRR